MIVGVRIEGDRRGRRQIAKAHLIEAQGSRRHLAQRIHVEPVLQLGHRDGNRARSVLQKVRAAGQQLFLAHPDDVGGELVGDFGPAFGIAQHIAARDVEFIGKDQSHRFARARRVKIAVGGDDARNLRRSCPKPRPRSRRPALSSRSRSCPPAHENRDAGD